MFSERVSMHRALFLAILGFVCLAVPAGFAAGSKDN